VALDVIRAQRLNRDTDEPD